MAGRSVDADSGFVGWLALFLLLGMVALSMVGAAFVSASDAPALRVLGL